MCNISTLSPTVFCPQLLVCPLLATRRFYFKNAENVHGSKQDTLSPIQNLWTRNVIENDLITCFFLETRTSLPLSDIVPQSELGSVPIHTRTRL